MCEGIPVCATGLVTQDKAGCRIPAVVYTQEVDVAFPLHVSSCAFRLLEAWLRLYLLLVLQDASMSLTDRPMTTQ